jgi:tRNA-splicing ligase RtcB (3'-phosphate/5'-hydroxy nucleic acid ligase)
MSQLGSYGGGNHFGECEVVDVVDNDRARRTVADSRSDSRQGHVAFLSRTAARAGSGYNAGHASVSSALQAHVSSSWGIPLPGGDRELVSRAARDTSEADAYLDDMALGANFATVNHLLINALVVEAFQEVMPGVTAQLDLLHQPQHRPQARSCPTATSPPGSTARAPRAPFRPATRRLAGTPFAETGHPILLPGNPQAGSCGDGRRTKAPQRSQLTA